MHLTRYKAELAGITVQDDVDERSTSRTCHACGEVRSHTPSLRSADTGCSGVC
ncbi:MAG: zinc ribbon domain-containing protein [Bacillota bacterium]